MLKGMLIHPEILAVLGRSGHTSRILVADGDYPFASKLGPRATLVNLNLMPGLVSCTQALEALLAAIVVERAQVMEPMREGRYAMAGDPPIGEDYRHLIAAAGLDVEGRHTCTCTDTGIDGERGRLSGAQQAGV